MSKLYIYALHLSNWSRDKPKDNNSEIHILLGNCNWNIYCHFDRILNKIWQFKCRNLTITRCTCQTEARDKPKDTMIIKNTYLVIWKYLLSFWQIRAKFDSLKSQIKHYSHFRHLFILPREAFLQRNQSRHVHLRIYLHPMQRKKNFHPMQIEFQMSGTFQRPRDYYQEFFHELLP